MNVPLPIGNGWLPTCQLFPKQPSPPCPKVSLWAAGVRELYRPLLSPRPTWRVCSIPSHQQLFTEYAYLARRYLHNREVWFQCHRRHKQKLNDYAKKIRKNRYSGECNGDINVLPFGYKTSVSVFYIWTVGEYTGPAVLTLYHMACTWDCTWDMSCTWDHTWDMPCTWGHTWDMSCLWEHTQDMPCSWEHTWDMSCTRK